MKITGDPLIDLIIWHEATDPYEDEHTTVSPKVGEEVSVSGAVRIIILSSLFIALLRSI